MLVIVTVVIDSEIIHLDKIKDTKCKNILYNRSLMRNN